MNIVYNVINYYIIDKSFMNLIFFLFFKCINYMLHWLSYYCSLLHLGLLVSNIYIYITNLERALPESTTCQIKLRILETKQLCIK